MHVLLLAPHPFYQDRGTPIAVNLVLNVLSERGERVDVITYHEGREVKYPHVTVHRIPALPFIHHIRPGFSWKKVICDIFMAFKAFRLVFRNNYHLVHGVEESVFIAILLKLLFNIPYVYDMDSSLAQQMIEKYPLLTPFAFVLNLFEAGAVKNAKAVVPMCDALVDHIEKYKPERVVVLQDVPLLGDVGGQAPFDLKADLGISDVLVMYVGNLEAYQGIDLLLESFALLLEQTDRVNLVIIGGEAADIHKYRKTSCDLRIQHKVHFLGPKPVEHLGGYLTQADILVSPRIKGENTPMKLYSYLDSGKAILATELPTHTQVLDSRVAMLAGPSPEAFAKGMLRLVEDAALRVALGRAGKGLVEEKFSYGAFCNKLNDLFDWLRMEIGKEQQGASHVAGRSSRERH